jgi:ketosteroid isomerase-like protein
VSTNLNLVRSICAEWDRGDYSSTDWAHPEIDLVFADGLPPTSWSGLAGMAEGWRQFLSTWDEFHQEAVAYRELDHERVLVFFHFAGRGKTSGVELGPMRSDGAGVFHVRDGKVTRFVAYVDRERALADLGLPSEATSADS